MKKTITKIVTVVSLLALVLTGGVFGLLNQEAEARMVAKKDDVAKTTSSLTTKTQSTPKTVLKICAHTTVYVELSKTDGNTVRVVTKKGTYSHDHEHAWSYDIANENNMDKVRTQTSKCIRVESAYGHVDLRTKKEFGFYSWCGDVVGSNKKLPVREVNKVFNCSECKLHKTSPNGTITLETPCCGETVYINAQTGRRR